MFIAIVPIVLIVLLVGLGMFIVGGQFAALLVTANLRGRLRVRFSKSIAPWLTRHT